MDRRLLPACLFISMIVALAGGSTPAAEAGRELLADPGLSSAAAQDQPGKWSIWTPQWQKASCDVRPVEGGLRVHAPREPYAVGGVFQDVKGIEAGKHYAIEVACTARGIASPYQSVLVRLTWLRGGKPLHPAGAYVRGQVADGEKLQFRDVLLAPKDADGARVALEVKWPQGGSVLWQRAGMKAAGPPSPRVAKIGTVYLRPKNSTPERNLDLFCAQIDEAGRLGLDIVCLPEAITFVGTGRKGPEVTEPIPGPSTERLGSAAKKNRLWVVAGLYERDGDRMYNTAVLLDRQGRLAGKYRKIHLPREEWLQGITPGAEYPVFRTDFGTIAIQICYDWFFPEVGSIFGLKGAEIIFAPTWGDTAADVDGRPQGESAFRVRARDNAVYLVPSVFDGQSMVIDPMGRILVSNKGRDGVFWCEVDLNRREALPWVGHWGSIGPRDRMPATYGPLGDPPKLP